MTYIIDVIACQLLSSLWDAKVRDNKEFLWLQRSKHEKALKRKMLLSQTSKESRTPPLTRGRPAFLDFSCLELCYQNDSLLSHIVYDKWWVLECTFKVALYSIFSANLYQRLYLFSTHEDKDGVLCQLEAEALGGHKLNMKDEKHETWKKYYKEHP